MHQLSSYLSADCVLIIDGPNLVYRFHEHMGLDSLCGGQYEEFYQGLIDFFSALRQDCPRLRVLMLLDEVTEEEKLEVVRSRQLEKVKQWVKAIELAQSFSTIPLGAWDVFKEAVRVCGVETLCYDSEADDFISALAVHYTQQGTPAFILSQDSDFYFIVGVTGVISMDDIVWSPGSRTRPVMRKSEFFSLPDFLRTVRCLAWMIPFLAILSGNDFTPPELKTAMEPIKTEFLSESRGPFFARVILHLTVCTQTEVATIAIIKSSLKPGMCAIFDKTYRQTKNRYLNPLGNIPTGDVPTPQLKRMRLLYPGLCQESLLRISALWTNKIGLKSKASSFAEDYKQPRASLASLALRSYWHGVVLLPTQEGTGVSPPKYVVEMCRKISGAFCAGDTDTFGNEITEEEVKVFYKVGGRCLPNLSQLQELSKGDKLQFFRSVMHCSDCQVLFSDTEFINYEVSVIIATLYYWFHEISFRENRSPSSATPISILQRQELLRILLNSALAVYFKDQLILPILKVPNLKSVTRHHFHHSVAEWLYIQNDTNMLLTVLDLPTVPIRRSFNGHLLFRMITDPEYCSAVSSLLSSLMREELHDIFQALLTPYSG